MQPDQPAVTPKFCSECGTALNPGARFCHNCGVAITGRGAGVPAGGGAAGSSGSKALIWGVPTVAVIAVIIVSAIQAGSDQPRGAAEGGSMNPDAVRAPDISSMTPAERADRLFDRVMRLSSEGKADSAAFFGPMALGALEALAPLDLHRRFDVGRIALVIGDITLAKAQADTILAQNPTHLLGLSLAARAADARGSTAAANDFRRRLLAAEAAEKARALPEYTDHAGEIAAALSEARSANRR